MKELLLRWECVFVFLCATGETEEWEELFKLAANEEAPPHFCGSVIRTPPGPSEASRRERRRGAGSPAGTRPSAR